MRASESPTTTTARDEPLTVVVFRVERAKRGGGVVAFFPELPADTGGRFITCYAHVGQHGSADWNYVTTRTRPATPAEYGPLAHELEGIGYRLAVRKRRRSHRLEGSEVKS